MKKLSFSLFLFTVFLLHLNAQQVIYVQSGGTGNGSSWKDAIGNLTKALKIAKDGTQIWVAKGTYFPSQTDRTISFEIKDGVEVYGGFIGVETQLNQRSWEENPTLLSGEIGSQFSNDNSYNIVYTKNVSARTIVDGFTITGGSATGETTTGDRKRCGGAWYNNGKYNNSSPTINNCIFIGNYSRDGGAIYNNGKGGKANPTISNCQFIANVADLDGGAIFNDGRNSGQSNPIITDCTFENNKGNYGGAVFNYGGAGESSPTFVNCEFMGNEAHLKGAGMYNLDVEGISLPTIKDCRFVEETNMGFSAPVYQHGDNAKVRYASSNKQIKKI